ncbi:MAG: aldolase [Candidatus Cohnella colombiensis]|uniref:Aldolase n=1 Tax=Candidatus Cohnella colombiensis TaxID=3121368 RepID=A0AA95EY42_9BACL|nr:MAG: aldolase [Cohnella sp.]
MVSIAVKQRYQAFGYTVASDIVFPELIQSQDDSCDDVTIQLGDLTAEWQQLGIAERASFVTEQRIVFKIANTAIFAIQDGATITVSPLPDADEDHIRLYLLGSCMGALLFQRKVLPLHGSAIVIGGKAYAFVGDSGAGKSTLASAFLQRGHQLISDDVIAISLSAEGIPMVTPSYPQQKLWQQSLDGFGMQNTNLRPIFQRETKFTVPVRSMFQSEPLPLAGVFELRKGELDTIQCQPITGLARLSMLYQNTYRNNFIARMKLQEWHLRMTATIVNQLLLFTITRPLSGFTAPDIVNRILQIIDQEG